MWGPETRIYIWQTCLLLASMAATWLFFGVVHPQCEYVTRMLARFNTKGTRAGLSAGIDVLESSSCIICGLAVTRIYLFHVLKFWLETQLKTASQSKLGVFWWKNFLHKKRVIQWGDQMGVGGQTMRIRKIIVQAKCKFGHIFNKYFFKK